MWIVADGVLMQLPDDVPVPSRGHVVQVPKDFIKNPEHYRVVDEGVSRRSDQEIEQLQTMREQARLTPQEIALVKRAIAEGWFESPRKAGSKPAPRPRTTRAESGRGRRKPT